MQTNFVRRMGRIVRTAFSWALVGGFVTATMGLVAVMLNSDTGHVSRYAVPAMLGIPGFVVGLFIGAAFSSVATAVHEYYQTRRTNVCWSCYRWSGRSGNRMDALAGPARYRNGRNNWRMGCSVARKVSEQTPQRSLSVKMESRCLFSLAATLD